MAMTSPTPPPKPGEDLRLLSCQPHYRDGQRPEGFCEIHGHAYPDCLQDRIHALRDLLASKEAELGEASGLLRELSGILDVELFNRDDIEHPVEGDEEIHAVESRVSKFLAAHPPREEKP